MQHLNTFEPPAAAAEHWDDFEGTVGKLRRNVAEWPAELDLVHRWYQPHLERIYDDFGLREADLHQLSQIAGTYPSRERFLTELTLDPPDATSDQAGTPLLDEDYLILSTIHSAKGQEWRSVFLLNTVDGCLPSDLAAGSTGEIEEERRLLYVAMTRAKDQLHLMVPQRFYTHGQRSSGDRHVYAQRSRFIPSQVLECFECRSWPASTSEKAASEKRKANPVDVRAKMRRMWA
jgi:DNA helicase-2/ATP-dependent DNA helicase PcrA